MWKFIDSGKKSAKENMDLDHRLLENLDPLGDPILHYYDWEKPSFTHGYFVDPKNFLNLSSFLNERLDWARRPTGGGIIFHLTDLAFSVLIPASHPLYTDNTLTNYEGINQKVALAVKEILKEDIPSLLVQEEEKKNSALLNFCMAKPTIYDVMLGNKKIAGAAQRRKKQGFLHQGTISIVMPKVEFLEEILLENSIVLEEMKKNTHSLLPANWSSDDLTEMRKKLKKLLKNRFLED